MDGEEKKDQNQGAENQSGGEPLETTTEAQGSAAPQPSGSLDEGPAPVVETSREDELNKPGVDQSSQSVSGSGSNQLRTLLIVLVVVLVVGVGGIVAWQTFFS